MAACRVGLAARARLTGCAGLERPDAGRYCLGAGAEAGDGAPVDSSGASMSGVPDVSGVLSDDAVSAPGLTSDGGGSTCSSGLGGNGGTVGRYSGPR